MLLAAAVFLVVSMSARPLRHVTVYRDDSRAATLLRIVQNERMALFTRSYTVRLADGTALAQPAQALPAQSRPQALVCGGARR